MKCKICQSEAPHFFACDLHNNASYHHGFWSSPVNPCGKIVNYYKCVNCGFIFSPFMDNWAGEAFTQRIYNADYAHLDSGYMGARGGCMANNLWLALGERIKELSFLDYGCGSGIQTEILKKFGALKTDCFDPFGTSSEFSGQYDIVTCSEVIEHSTDPQSTIHNLMAFVKEEGLIIATTELIPDDIDRQKDKWWYVNPRVGHISFYSRKALATLYRGFTVLCFGTQLHMAYRKWPAWADKIRPVLSSESEAQMTAISASQAER